MSWTWRPATDESDPWRIVAVVPLGRGAKSSETVIVTTASPSSPSPISFTEPAARPPTMTWFPGTSWLAFWNSAVISYSSSPAHEHDEKHRDGDDRKDRRRPCRRSSSRC